MNAIVSHIKDGSFDPRYYYTNVSDWLDVKEEYLSHRSEEQQLLLDGCIAQFECITTKCIGCTPPELDLVKANLTLTFLSMQKVLGSEEQKGVILATITGAMSEWFMAIRAATSSMLCKASQNWKLVWI